MGGFELKLVIDGAEAFILEQEFPQEASNSGPGPGQLRRRASSRPEVHGRAPLSWCTGRSCSRAGPRTCGSAWTRRADDLRQHTEGCPARGTAALYIGTEHQRQLGAIFGRATCRPGSTPTGEPDLTPVTGKESWQDVGEFLAARHERLARLYVGRFEERMKRR